MNLNLDGKLFVVTGATSGFGKAIAEALVREKARVIINARGEEKLKDLQANFPDQIEILPGDITTDATISKLILLIGKRDLSGIVVNAGGPPAKSFARTSISDWDKAYETLLRWKVKLTKEILPLFQKNNYGRVVYIESSSVKQPIDNLILSTSLRLSVVGFVKSLSQEIAAEGINLNILAPGYHATPAMERLFINKSAQLGITPEEAKVQFEQEILVGRMGNPGDLASLACWLLSPLSGYITGQTISIDGGLIKSTFS
ncbi:MAG: SDR family oxidoreductase [Saprospiraceae bacterium]|nr:SDR family oxidoreductase [Bacteroidia bacterium]NNK89534.1 SDR family oxidoreductase [Saprospiraceae bacterium]